jgi:hypothetical protein
MEEKSKGLLEKPEILGRQRAIMKGLLRYIHGKRRTKNDVQDTLKAVSHSLKLKIEAERKKLDYSKIRNSVKGLNAVASIYLILNNK